MRNLVKFINQCSEYETLACCCGHGKYPPTLILKNLTLKHEQPFDVFTYVHMDRKKRFYKRDKEGYYYIPEVII
jgi:hypothetical protein